MARKDEPTKEELEELVDELWPEVLDLFQPRPDLLRQPALVEDEHEGELMHSVGSHQVTINESYLRALLPYADDARNLVRGILTHTVCHYMHFPSHLSVTLVLQQMAHSSFDWLGEQAGKKDFGETVFRNYIDVVDNVSAFFNTRGGNEGVAELFTAMSRAVGADLKEHPELADHYRPLLLNLDFYKFQFKDRMPDEVSVPENLKPYTEEMHKIPFLTEFGWPFMHSGTLDQDSFWWHLNAMRQYGRLLLEMDQQQQPGQQGGEGDGEGEEQQGQQQQSGGGQGKQKQKPQQQKGKGKGQKQQQQGSGQGQQPAMTGTCGDFGHNHGGPGSGKPTPQQLEEALDQIRQAFPKHQYDKLREFAKQQYPECFQPPKGKGEDPDEGQGIGKGGAYTQLNTDESVIDYYLALLDGQRLPLHIRPKRLRSPKDGGFPMLRDPYEIGDPMHLIDLIRSGGKVLPGITPVKEMSDDKTYHRAPRVPHALIIMDSSGSMPDPTKHKSDHVMVGLHIAQTYLANRALVGVINFSSQSYPVPYGRNRETIAYGLLGYQCGGTELDLDVLDKILPPDQKKRFMGHGGRLQRDQTEGILDWMKSQGPMGQEMYQKAMKKSIDVDVDADTLREDIADLTLDALDVYIISDGGIFNLEAMYKRFEQMAQKCRITILHCPCSYDMDLKGLPKEVIYRRISKASDLMSETLGVLRERIKDYDDEG